MPWYRSGTVAITSGQTSVVGTNTDFAANARVGDAFQGPDGRWYEVANIASATVLSILPSYQGATVSAGGYGLAPMQGYVKDSADALRAIVNQYGAKLAALGTTGNYDILPVAKGGTGGSTAADARAGLGLGSVATESTVPVAKGGTGGTTAAAGRAGLGLGTAATLAAVGTVGVSGGTPTGAIMERGSNANGVYIRYADGTQECICSVLFPAIGLGVQGGTVTINFPISFADTNYSYYISPYTVNNGNYSGMGSLMANGIFVNGSRGVWSLPLTTYSYKYSQDSGVSCYVLIKGRWY